MPFAYILTNKINTVLYTGVTNNIERRVFEHKYNKRKKSFTTRYNVKKLVWLEEFSSIDEAISAEKKIKGWSRKRKNDLIKKDNPNFEEIRL